MPTWTTPKTWSTGEALAASDMNTHIRDNLGALKAPPTDSYVGDEVSNYTTNQTTFVDVDGTNLTLTITTSGGDVLAHFHGFIAATGGTCHLDLSVNGSREGGDDGITLIATGYTVPVSFSRLISNLDAGTHTFKLQWRMTAGTGTLYAGAGTANLDVHPQFWVREI